MRLRMVSGNGFICVSAFLPVAMKLLNPFEIDHRDNANFQIRVLRDICVVSDQGAVKTFVKKDVAAGQVLPRA